LFLNFLLDAELTYLYTNDASYLMNDFGLTVTNFITLGQGQKKTGSWKNQRSVNLLVEKKNRLLL